MLATPGNSACRFLRRTLNNCTRSLALEAVTVAEYEHTGRINVNPKEVIAGERRKTFLEEILQPNFKALLVDAAGTLLLPSEPAAEVCTYPNQKHDAYQCIVLQNPPSCMSLTTNYGLA